MHATKRGVRRAVARRSGTKWQGRDSGQLIEGTVEGRAHGVRSFDFENWFGKHGGFNTDADVVIVHFRHPTKKRTPGRVCQGRFFQSGQLQRENAFHG